MSNFNLPTPTAPSNEPGPLGILSGVLGGLHSVNQRNVQEKQEKEKFAGDQALQKQQQELNAQTIAQNQATTASQQASVAKTRGDQALQMIWADPTGQRAKDPAFQHAVMTSLQAQGLPVPLLGDQKSIDFNALKPSIGDMFKDPKAVTAFMQQPQNVRQAIASKYSDFPKTLTTAAQQADLRGEAALTRATAYAKNLPEVTKIADKRVEAQAKLYGDIGNMDAAHAALYAQDSLKAKAEAGVVQQKADALSTRAQAYATSVHNAAQRYQNGDRGAAGAILRSADSQLRTYNTEIDSLTGQWEKLASDPTVDADDPRLAAITTAIGNAQKARDTSQQEIDSLRSSIQSGQGTAKFLGGASGVNVTPASTNKGSNTLYSTSGGKPIISTDGGKTWNFSS